MYRNRYKHLYAPGIKPQKRPIDYALSPRPHPDIFQFTHLILDLSIVPQIPKHPPTASIWSPSTCLDLRENVIHAR